MPARATLKDIARASGVHYATVSRALRDDPRISRDTMRRIKDAANRLGYEPDPMLKALAVYRTGLRPTGFKETLGFIWPEASPEEVVNQAYWLRSIRAAREHAALLGYNVDEFYLREHPEGSMDKVLRARGIRGLIIGSVNRNGPFSLSLDLDRYAVATMTTHLEKPHLHLAGHDHFFGMQKALHHLSALGYGKIAFLVGSNQNALLNKKYTGSFLMHHPMGPEAAFSLMREVLVPGTEEMEKILRDLRPEALLMTYTPSPLPVQPAESVPIVSLDLLPEEPTVAGIYQQISVAAAAAIDCVVEQIHYGRRGIPQQRKIILTDGQWVNHPSCPNRSAMSKRRSPSKISSVALRGV